MLQLATAGSSFAKKFVVIYTPAKLLRYNETENESAVLMMDKLKTNHSSRSKNAQESVRREGCHQHRK